MSIMYSNDDIQALRDELTRLRREVGQLNGMRRGYEHLLLAGHELMGHLSRVGYEDDSALGKTELGLLVKGFRLALEDR